MEWIRQLTSYGDLLNLDLLAIVDGRSQIQKVIKYWTNWSDQMTNKSKIKAIRMKGIKMKKAIQVKFIRLGLYN